MFRCSLTGWANCCVMLLAIGGSISLAGENPFGMPEPRDPAQPGSIVLHGGGYGLSEDICLEFVRLAGGPHARILLIPSEMYQFGQDVNGNPIQETAAEFEHRVLGEYTRWEPLVRLGRVASVRVFFRDPAGDPQDRRFFRLLEEATGVWMPASDPNTLPERFANQYPEATSRFQLALRSVVSRGGVVGGLGGGMSCLSETVITKDLDDDGGWQRAELRFGLSLLNGVVLDQNFDKWAGRLERMTDLLRNGPKIDRLGHVPGIERRTIGIGVDRHTAVILQGNSVRVMGEGQGHLFLKGNGDRTITWRQVQAGDEPVTVTVNRKRAGAHIHQIEAAPRFNPFGLPEPKNPDNPGMVVLHGGNDTGEIVEMYPSLAGAPSPRMVHCPAARESCRPGPDKNRNQLDKHLNETFDNWRNLEKQRRLDTLTFLTTNDRHDANRDQFVQPLKDANAVWFCGGDQNDLAALFVDRVSPTLFQEAVSEVVARGGVAGGSSAGLAIMSEIMIGAGTSIDDKPAQAELSRGFGVLKNVIAEQHFDARRGRIERLTGVLRDHKRLANFSPTCQPRKLIGIAVEEDTALILCGCRMRVCGKKLAHVFVQASAPRTIVWHALQSGDHAALRLQGEEFVLIPEDWSFESR